MKKLFLILCFIQFFSSLRAQYAEFSTDTTRFRRFSTKGVDSLPKYISEQEWFINGQKMSYGSGTIRVLVNKDKLDTLLYKGYKRTEYDTIICNIAEPKKYTFFYNDCCGAFNIQDNTTRQFIKGKVTYKLINSKSNDTYLGTLGESGILLSPRNTDTLTVDCRSAMSPNIYSVSLQKIKINKDSSKNDSSICLQEKGTDEPNWDFSYKTIDQKLSFLFMPLKQEPLLIIYDEDADTIKID